MLYGNKTVMEGKMKIPFIKLFNYPTGKYFYDVYKNVVVKVKEETYNKLQYLCKYGDENNQLDYNEEITELLKDGFLSEKKDNIIIHPYTDLCDDYIDKKVQNVILQVTQNCNFKCRYCSFSGEGYLDRTRKNISMSWEIAKKSIDYVLLRNIECNHITFSFYGGEPLIEYDLIKKCIEYITDKAYGKTLNFSMTINGYLLNDEIINFFIKHKVKLTFSIDGPKIIHDKNRRLLGTGEGTFDVIINNLKKIYDLDFNFFKSISVNAVWDLEEDYDKVLDFFNSHYLLKELNVVIEVVNSGRINTAFTITKENLEKQSKFICKCILANINLIDMEKNIQYKRIIDSYIKFCSSFEEMDNLSKEIHHSGPCIPGYHRLFIDVNGNFLPCEKISGNSEVMKIGNIYKGFNIQKIKELLNIGKLTENECKNCWAINLCSICPIYVDNLDSLSRKFKLDRCSIMKKQLIKDIKDNIILKEIGFHE